MTKYLLKGGTIATCEKGKPGVRVFKSDVLVAGTTITKIEENMAPEAGVEVIDCTDKWITPGFVDTHRHVFMAVMRGNHCDWLLTEYFIKSPARHLTVALYRTVQGDLTPDEVRIGTLAGCLDALHNGVTTLLDHFHAANTRAHLDAALAATLESGARLRADGRVTLGLAYDVLRGADVAPHVEFVRAARAAGARIVTAHALVDEHVTAWRDAGLIGTDVPAGARGPRGAAWKVLKESGAGIGATPVDELGMGHGNPLALEALARGVKCGLGADAVSINGGDMFTQMRTQLQWSRGATHENIRQNKLALPYKNEWNSADVFRLATLGGAECLNMGDLIGTVEVGKRADLLVFDTNTPNLGGAADPVTGVVFHAGSEDVETVFVDGEMVKKNGKLVRSWGPVAMELRKHADAIRERWSANKLEGEWKKWWDTFGSPVW
ncbi:Metallo-dependent hydrolase [Epithele typhae]|uniref:Metallo-dependent hydrolase n=1 Tax=Epithele typhae TaxID=378194 RepID=UPI002008C919|nr:Metallo-dependent hydrolase [Epithele typhae]KAH9928565.1 Metallo-dependent hydrolase [Epithele typhae]